jgi:esterase/lipase superfamily enzyme/TRAP-type C4-dicarboxylate transport system substrate-binding protein
MFKQHVLAAFIFIISTSALIAQEYRVLLPGNPPGSHFDAVTALNDGLSQSPTKLEVEPLAGVFLPKDFLEALQSGHADFAVVPFEALPDLARSPLLEPFLAGNAREMRQAINSEIGALAKTDLEREGFRVLDIWHLSSSIFSSRTPLASPESLRGLKVRVAPGPQVETLAALGAAPVPVPAAEIFSALSTGSIDASDLAIEDQNVGLGLYDVVDNYVDRVFRPQLYAVVVEKDHWDALPFAHQHDLAKAAFEAGESFVEPLDQDTIDFRATAIADGSNFSDWSPDDIQVVRFASLAALPPDLSSNGDLINIAYDRAAAPEAPLLDGDRLPAADVTILFATDRIEADLSRPETSFSAGRVQRGHTFGIAPVALHANRQLGSDLENVSTIGTIAPMSPENFQNALKGAGDQDIIVFVHGYNNSFTDAIRRSATIRQDIAPDSIVIAYTWPSDGELLSYAYDESSTDTALQNFKLFMDMLTETVPSDSINIIAHSMGSRLVTKYVGSLAERGRLPDTTKFENIVFAAADISTEFFQQQEEKPFDPRYPLSAYAERITVYSSENDMPLNVSNRLHGDQRLGLADHESIYLEADIIAIDASPIDPKKFRHIFTFETRHSYVFDKAAGVRDLSLLLAGTGAQARPNIDQRSRDGLDFFVLTSDQ